MPIFISYSHENKAFVDNLATHLVSHNANVWVDRWELNVGDSIVQRVQSAIQSASALLVVLSKASVASEWCKRELSAGLVRELEEKKVIVLPLLIEDCDIPLFLKEKLYADFRNDFDTGLSHVLEAIARVVNCNQGRIAVDEYNIDWGISWGYRGNLFELSFMFVHHGVDHPYTVVTEAIIYCNDVATKRYKQYEHLSLDWIGRLVMFESVFENVTNKNAFRILFNDQFPKEYMFDFTDQKHGLNYSLLIKCRRIGEDIGKSTLIDIIQYFDHVRNEMRDKSRKLTHEEQTKLSELISKPIA